MNRHTPGPWRQEHEIFKNGDCYRLRGSREEHLGDLYGAHRAGEEGEYAANARLIAAAPELLDHLEAVLCAAECSEEFIEGERGKGWSVEQLYAAGEMPDELVAARAFLAQLKGEQP